MTDPLHQLEARDRREIESLALARGVSAEALLPEIVAAWLRLLRDVPGALPRNPLEPIARGAARRDQQGRR